MRDFDADLTRAFAALEDPADDGFSRAVTHRVAAKERARSFGSYTHVAAFLIAGAAFAYGVISAFLSMGPTAMAELGLGVAEAHSALATGSIPAGIGALATPFLIAVATGIGGLAVARGIAR